MGFLLLARLKTLKNWLIYTFTHRWEFFKTLSTVVFGLVLMGGLYWWMARFLGYLNGVPTIGILLTQKLFEIAFLSAFSLIALSAFASSLSTHFGASDLSLLFSMPVKNLTIFLSKSWEAMIHSSWMMALVLVPFLMALSHVKGLSPVFLVAAFALFIPFAFSASVVGIALASVFASLFPKRKLTEFLSVLGVLIFVFLYTGIRLTLPQRLIHPERMEEVLEYLLYLQAPAAPIVPSRWFVGALNAIAANDWTRLVFSSGVLFAYAGLALIVLVILGTYVITPYKWALILEGGSTGARGQLLEKTPFPQPRKISLRSLLFLKEFRFFLRDSQRFSNSSFILAVVAIYLVSIYKLPMDTPYLKNFISFVNLALGLFIVAALSLRFCFPQISLELPYSWILRASPLSEKEFVKSKFLFNFLFLGVLGLVMVILSPVLLGTDLTLIPIYMAAALCLAGVLSILSLAIGGAFPKIRWENIVQIETSFGGFLYAACALGFVALTLAVFAWPIKFYFDAEYLHRPVGRAEWAWLSILAVGYLGISLVVSYASWRWSRRSWLNLET